MFKNDDDWLKLLYCTFGMCREKVVVVFFSGQHHYTSTLQSLNSGHCAGLMDRGKLDVVTKPQQQLVHIQDTYTLPHPRVHIVVTWWIMESLWMLWPRWDTSHCPGIKTNGGHQGHLQQQIWGCDPVIMCGWLLVVGVDHEWEHFSWLQSPSSPVTVRARPVPPSYLVTIIRYNFTTP